MYNKIYMCLGNSTTFQVEKFITCSNLNIFCSSMHMGFVLIAVISPFKIQFSIGKKSPLCGLVQ